MRFLTRMSMVFVLLGGLAYGSYAFGKYVLSTRLFGAAVPAKSGSALAPSGRSVSATVTRQVPLKGNKARVEVEVLPAQSAGQSPEPPPIEVLARQAKEKGPSSNEMPSSLTTSKPKSASSFSSGSRQFDNVDGIDYSLNGEGLRSRRDRDRLREGRDEEERPRRRRRRRRRTIDTNRTSPSTTSSARDDEIATPPPDETEYGSGNDSAPRISNNRSRRRRNRSESRSEGSSRSESPVPQPEGESSSSGGGESPVPQPE